MAAAFFDPPAFFFFPTAFFFGMLCVFVFGVCAMSSASLATVLDSLSSDHPHRPPGTTTETFAGGLVNMWSLLFFHDTTRLFVPGSIATTAGLALLALALDATSTTTTKGRLQREVNVLLRVEADNIGGDSDKLVSHAARRVKRERGVSDGEHQRAGGQCNGVWEHEKAERGTERRGHEHKTHRM